MHPTYDLNTQPGEIRRRLVAVSIQGETIQAQEATAVRLADLTEVNIPAQPGPGLRLTVTDPTIAIPMIDRTTGVEIGMTTLGAALDMAASVGRYLQLQRDKAPPQRSGILPPDRAGSLIKNG